jgi:hypothetical protein
MCIIFFPNLQDIKFLRLFFPNYLIFAREEKIGLTYWEILILIPKAIFAENKGAFRKSSAKIKFKF